MIDSNRIIAKSLEANPDIHANNNIVKVINELRPAAFVIVEDLICFDEDEVDDDDGGNDDFLSGNITFLTPVGVALLECMVLLLVKRVLIIRLINYKPYYLSFAVRMRTIHHWLLHITPREERHVANFITTSHNTHHRFSVCRTTS